jgi:hypothetical protein
VTTHGWPSGHGSHHGDPCQFMKSRPSEFTPTMLAARTPDAVPNHPGSTNVQRANVPTFPHCFPCTSPHIPECLSPLTLPPSPCPVVMSKSRRFQPYPSTTTDKTRNTVDRC